jgi:aryl-alcohol dehydrogenase-like predicted oxidoreductase
MQTRPLGRTGERVSALGFGCMGLVGWYGERDDDEARATLLAALDSGCTHLDTASSYQLGENEKFVGATIKGRRDEVFLATKYGIVWKEGGALTIDNSPGGIVSTVDASLGRLQTDRIDLFYLHRIDRNTPVEESVGTLAKLVKAGKVRYIGLSECSPETLRRAHAAHPIAAVQCEYSVWCREPEQTVLPVCRELGIGFVPYSPLGRGFLAGNFRTLADLPQSDARRNMPRFHDANVQHNLRIVDAVRDMATRKGVSPAQIALAWVLAQGDDILPIPGTKRRTRLAENVGAVNVRLTTDELAALTSTVADISVHGERYAPAMMKALNG